MNLYFLAWWPGFQLQHMQDKCEELGLAKEDAAAAKKGRKSKK